MGISSVMQGISAQLHRINRGVADGTITQGEAQGLRARLKSLEGFAARDSFDGPRMGGLGRLMLKHISQSVSTAAANTTTDPTAMRRSIGRKIEQGLADGSLTDAEAVSMRIQLASARTPEELKAAASSVNVERHDGEMNAMRRVESMAQRTINGMLDGSLTPDEALRLASRLSELGKNPSAKAINAVSADIFRQRHDAQVNRDVGVTVFGDRLGDLVQRGRITPQQADGLRAQLRELGAADPQMVGPRLNVLREQLDTLLLTRRKMEVEMG